MTSGRLFDFNSRHQFLTSQHQFLKSFSTKTDVLDRSRTELYEKYDNGYPHDGRADKNPYPHDRRSDKDSYPHDSNNQCIILGLQLSFAMINVQLMLV